ncbi:MAG: pantoate--beta-alanine ligase [Myxococcales bacterium]|nr:pantoate--beta-alanine ligase [Myxococcales bacterium]MCB9700287.1 pantoate--beta-alanine ligase [Myxococcales bacterium]
MIVLRTRDAVLAWRQGLADGATLAFVPTMGFLHEGHLSLMREARRRAGDDGVVAISIFVNPTQFGPGEDLDRYPRDEAGDLAKAAAAGVDVAFCPADPAELYARSRTWVEVEGLDRHLCGRSRPGHFRGVTTIVAKLWGLIRPDVAIFGEKDFQQLAILRRMHADLNLGGEIVGMPIVRETDGLAMSSRNANLDPASRAAARAIPGFMAEVRRRFDGGARSVDALIGDARDALEPGVIDYVEVVDAELLEPIAEITGPALCAVAVRFGGVRLIDNALLRP